MQDFVARNENGLVRNERQKWKTVTEVFIAVFSLLTMQLAVSVLQLIFFTIDDSNNVCRKVHEAVIVLIKC